MKQSKPVRTGAMYLGIYLLLLLLTIFIPAVELVTIFLLPLPFIVYTVQFGWKSGAGLAGAVFLLSILLFPGISLPFAFVAVFGGYMAGSAISAGSSAYETWARGTVGYLLGLISAFLFIQSVFSVNIIQETRAVIQSSVQSTHDTMETVGLDIGEEEMTAIAGQMEGLLDLLPVIFVVIALLLALITQWLGYKFLNKRENKLYKFPPFRTFRLPIAVIWIYFLAILATLISGGEEGTMYLAAVNVTNLAGVLMALQGLSFVFFYVHKKKLSKSIPIITIATLVFFPFIGLYLLRILGIIDLGFSLRDRINNDK